MRQAPQTPGRDGSLHSLRPSPYPLWQRRSQGDSDGCATLASPLLVVIRQRFSIYGDFIAQYGSPALLRIWSLFWGLPLAGHERYVFLQAKLRSATDTPAGKSGLQYKHNIRLLSEDTPLLSQESPHKWAFFFSLLFSPGLAGRMAHSILGCCPLRRGLGAGCRAMKRCSWGWIHRRCCAEPGRGIPFTPSRG